MTNPVITYPLGKGKPPWLAQLTGFSEKYPFAMDFASKTFAGGHVHFQLPSGDGVFQLCVDKSRAFFAVQGKRSYLLTKEEAEWHVAHRSVPGRLKHGWMPLSKFTETLCDHFGIEEKELRYLGW